MFFAACTLLFKILREKHAKRKACQEKEMSTKEDERSVKRKRFLEQELSRQRDGKKNKRWEQEMSGERSGKRCQANNKRMR